MCTRLAAASDKVYQLLPYGRWFTPVSSTTKTGRHDIAEILLKMALSTINQSINQAAQYSGLTRRPLISSVDVNEYCYEICQKCQLLLFCFKSYGP